MPKIGLVTVLFKSDNVLEGFIKSLSAQTFKDYHLYLIDNDPSVVTDRLIEALIMKYPLMSYSHIHNLDNYGVAKANNQGIELSLKNNDDYVLLLNNDIEFYQTTLISEMVGRAEKGENILIPKILYFDTKKIWMAGGKLLKRRGYTIHFGEGEESSIKFNVDYYCDYAPTCFMLISGQVFEQTGLMDEKYFVYYDDTDFILRATNRGYKILYMASLEVFHKVSSSTGGNESLFSVYYTIRNRIYFIRKNLLFPNKQIAMTYTLLTRLYKLIVFNKPQRQKFILALKDGFRM